LHEAVRTLKSFQIYKSEIKKSKTYSCWCSFQGLSNGTILMWIQSGQMVPLIPFLGNSEYMEHKMENNIFSLMWNIWYRKEGFFLSTKTVNVMCFVFKKNVKSLDLGLFLLANNLLKMNMYNSIFQYFFKSYHSHLLRHLPHLKNKAFN
jgi:hypothetical protein